ncbi:MAG: IclR family transcriptional regulator [Candidatus Binatia bacterium]
MSATAKAKDSPYNVQVLDRAAAILETLSESGEEQTLLDLSERLGLHKSTVHRLLMVLERHRYVEKNPASGRYALGLKLFELGQKAVSRLGLEERAHPHLEKLAHEVGETAHLCVLDEGEVLYLAKVEATRTVRVPSTVGRRNPAHCTAVGKALLAHCPGEEVERIVREHGLRSFTKHTIVTAGELARELAAIRERGYAVDDEEIEEGLTCIGAPVRDSSGRVVASISIAGPTFRIPKRKIATLASRVVVAANELSAELGHRPLRSARAGR